MADRILGMGDIVSLVEKAQEQFDEEGQKTSAKTGKNQFSLLIFLKQIQPNQKPVIWRFGRYDSGMGKALKDVEIETTHLNTLKPLLLDDCRRTRDQVSLNGSRHKRIADGSGTNIQEVNRTD